jgi:type IV fimbrial biogenesis protein FimT
MKALIPKPVPRGTSGFTLIELMVTVAMAAGVLTFGVPFFQSAVESVRLNTAASTFNAASNLARSEAVKRGTRVAICAGSNGTCGTNWKAGWIVFADLDRDCAINNASTDEIREVPGNPSLSWVNAETSTGKLAVTCIAFGSPGQVDGLSTGAAAPVTVTFCSTRGNSRVFDLNRVGHAALSTQTCTPI